MRSLHYALLLSTCIGMTFIPATQAQDAMNFDSVMGLGGMESTPKASTKVAASVTSYSNEPFIVVTELSIPDHWHAYYKNPGTFGEPIAYALTPVKGFKIDGPFWQTPTVGEGMTLFYGYSNKAKLAFRITPEADAPAEATFTTTMSWQMCDESSCAAPETKTNSITLKKGNGEAATDSAELLKGIAGVTTPSWAEGLQTRISHQQNTVTLHLKTAGKPLPDGKAYFFCDMGEILPTKPQELKKISDSEYDLVMSYNDDSDDMYENKLPKEVKARPLKQINGILQVGDDSIVISATDAPFSEASTTTSTSSANESGMSLWQIALFMFIGGIILNVMPCVFPVIGLKIMSFVQMSGGDRKKILTHSLVFVLGIMISFWVITAILIALKANMLSWSTIFEADFWVGNAADGVVNWAFWLENVWVNFFLLVLMFVLGLSMFGIFEIGVKATTIGGELQNKKGYAGSFWSGALATVISTPCSAPFLGQAIGATMLQPPLGIVICLSIMGLGMALPYIILGINPSLIKFLPKPGAWMESFKQAMSFLIFGTAAYFLWIYLAFFDAESDPQVHLMVFFGLVCLGLACWIYGKWCPMYQSKKSRIWGAVFTLIFGIAGVYLMLPTEAKAFISGEKTPSEASAKVAKSSNSIWKEWSPQAMQDALAAGKPVYVDFTARWCATCQVNKSTAYTDEVLALFEKHGVILMKADKTKPNKDIDLEIKRLKRTAVPVNVLYVPGKEPAITIEILTPGYMIDFINSNIK